MPAWGPPSPYGKGWTTQIAGHSRNLLTPHQPYHSAAPGHQASPFPISLSETRVMSSLPYVMCYDSQALPLPTMPVPSKLLAAVISLCVGGVSVPAGLAQPSCGSWLSASFFKAATASDVTRCLDAGANIEARSEHGVTPLHFAAGNSDSPAVVKALIDAGANIEARLKNGGTPLHVAADLNDSPAVVKELIDAGANIEARLKSGYTPLHVAAEFSDSPAVVKELIDAGANINIEAAGGGGIFAYVGWTPLHLAAEWSDSPAMVKALIDAGANIEARDKEGGTPLHFAARWSDSPAVVKALIDAGANGNAHTEDGKTPGDFAQYNAALKGTDVYWRLNEAQYE